MPKGSARHRKVVTCSEETLQGGGGDTTAYRAVRRAASGAQTDSASYVWQDAAVTVKHTPRGGAIVEGGTKARLAFFEQFLEAEGEELLA